MSPWDWALYLGLLILCFVLCAIWPIQWSGIYDRHPEHLHRAPHEEDHTDA